MSVHNGRFVQKIGPLLQIGISPNVDGTEASDAPLSPKVTALMDTGAASTCISHEAAMAAGVKALGLKDVYTVAGRQPRRYYLVSIVLAFPRQGPMRSESHLIPDIMAVEFTPHPDSPFQALLGRDILCSGLFTMSSDGNFSFAI